MKKTRTLGDIKDTGEILDEKRVTLGSAIRGLRHGSPASPQSRRLRETELSLEQFCLRYLPHHFSAAFCEMHYDIFRLCDDPTVRKRKARIAPRKFGKTTIICLALPLWELAYQKKWFILLIGESGDTAEANLATIAHEIETNDLLLEDFPHLNPARDPRGQTVKWTDRQLVFANFATVRAKGMGARMRGMKHRQRRPDLAILDDPESPETADTFLKRARHKRWFGGTFMGLGAENWDIYVIGNLPHHDCLIADLVKDKGWDGKLWRAENTPKRENERYPIGNTREDGSALWPGVWSLFALEQYRREPNVGTLGYAREMLNDPREEEDKAFIVESFCFIDAPAATYEERIVAVDPAGGENPGEVKRGKRDFCAIVAMGRTPDNFIDVLDVVMTKKLPDIQIEKILDMHAKWQCPISVEENMFKNLLKSSIARAARERGLSPSIRMHTTPHNKVTRILSLQPPINQRIMRFVRALISSVPEYFAQFDEYPGTYDDGPDATEIGLRRLERSNTKISFVSVTQSSYWRSIRG